MNTPAPGIDSSIALESEENKLLATANRMRTNNTLDAIKRYITDVAVDDGLSDDNLEAVVNRVMERLMKTETNRQGGKFGVAHNPNTQFQRIWNTIKTLRGPGF